MLVDWGIFRRFEIKSEMDAEKKIISIKSSVINSGSTILLPSVFATFGPTIIAPNIKKIVNKITIFLNDKIFEPKEGAKETETFEAPIFIAKNIEITIKRISILIYHFYYHISNIIL